jgi:hypothetical protein
LGVEVDLIRDVLDKQLLDRHGVKFSKVDGLTAIWEPNQQPRVAFVELGAVVLARRVGVRTERWISRLLSVRGSPEAVQIPWECITDIGVDIEVAVDSKRLDLAGWRGWLRENVLSKVAR